MKALCQLRTALLATAALGGAGSPLLAQTVPTTAAPTREEIDRPDLRPTARPPARLTVVDEVERAPCPLAAPAYAGISFTLADVVFNNLQGASAAELRAAYADYVGRTVPLATVCEIRDRAATILRRQGYLAAVQVPPQEIENGIVRFDVLMAKIVSVQVRGDAGRSEGTIAGFLDALTGMPVFNEREAARYLLLARDLPGYDVRLTLRPAGTAPGEVIGEVAVVHTPFEVDFNVQNYGSMDVGRWGGLLRAQFNGLTGLGDRTSIGVYSTADLEEQQVLQLFHDFAVGSEGLRLGGRFTHAWTNPGGNDELELKSRTLLASAEATFPFVRSLSYNAFAAAGFDLVNQEIDILGETTSRDKLRIAYLRADFDTLDEASLTSFGGFSAYEPRWRLGGSVELRQGLDILDATEFCAACPVQPSRVPGTAKGTVLRAGGLAEFRPLPNIAFSLAPRAQYSDDPLLAYEEFSGGNYTVGRGYDPGTIVGDSGYGVALELRLGTTVPEAADKLAFQPFAFFDTARVWNNRDDRSGSDSLHSVGGGVRVAYGDRARLDVTLAVPLKRVPVRNDPTGLQERRGDARLLVNFTTRLVPWRS
jgi:hemolysin activation/secretion protein